MTDLATARWRALGTRVDLLVFDGDLDAARVAVAAVLDDVDRCYSRFRPDSELSRLTRAAGDPFRVSPLFGMALEAAIRAGRLSDGLVDPTVGRAMRAVGYDADFDSLADRSGPLTVRLDPVPGWRAIRYDPRNLTVRLSPGVELDLGSTGKALAADLAATAAGRAAGARGTLVSLGGDLATSGDAPAGGWRVLAAEDSSIAPDQPGEVVAIDRGALATSGTTVRRWRRDGVELHHILDPRTGRPTDGPWRTVSVVAATCVDANVAATASIVLGDGAPAWLETLGLPARLVSTGGDVIRVAGWPVEVTTAEASLSPIEVAVP